MDILSILHEGGQRGQKQRGDGGQIQDRAYIHGIVCDGDLLLPYLKRQDAVCQRVAEKKGTQRSQREKKFTVLDLPDDLRIPLDGCREMRQNPISQMIQSNVLTIAKV